MKSSSAAGLSLFLSFCIVLFSGASFAQIGESSQIKSTKYFESGEWSIQAELVGFNSIFENLGLSISAKKYISSNSALQGGVELLGLLKNSTSGVTFNGVIPQFYSVLKYNLSSKGTQLYLKYLYYPLEHKRVTIFTGGGPLISYYVDRVNRNGVNSSNNETENYLVKGIGYSWATGLVLNTGIEWFAYDNLSIVAEYGIAGVFSWSDVTLRNINTNGPGETSSVYSDKSFSILPAMLKVGCSVSL